MSEADRSALEEISIRNLGVIENAVVPFTKGLNVLIGENDSGKTAIIDCLEPESDSYDFVEFCFPPPRKSNPIEAL